MESVQESVQETAIEAEVIEIEDDAEDEVLKWRMKRIKKKKDVKNKVGVIKQILDEIESKEKKGRRKKRNRS